MVYHTMTLFGLTHKYQTRLEKLPSPDSLAYYNASSAMKMKVLQRRHLGVVNGAVDNDVGRLYRLARLKIDVEKLGCFKLAWFSHQE